MSSAISRLRLADRAASLRPLLAAGWCDAGVQRDAIRKTFKFADFVHAWGFMTAVALRAEKLDHHPEWSNVYSTVDVTWSTHDAGGCSELDVAMAEYCDVVARMHEVKP